MNASSGTTAELLRDNDDAVIRIGRSFVDIQRADVLWVIVLTLFAFALRFASPVYPDALDHPFKGSPVTVSYIGSTFNGDGCIEDVPVGPNGASKKQCGFVFDEVYFPVDATKDMAQPALDYFDPEPPLTKLLMTPPIRILGFTTAAWRLSPAIFGSLMVGLVYLIARRLRRDRWFAVVASLFVAIDGLAFVEARTGVIDAIAVFFVVLTYYAFLLHWQARTRRQWNGTLYLMAAIAGLAFAAKLTALAPLAVGGALIGGRWVQPLMSDVFPWARRRGDRRRIDAGAQLWREAAGRAGFVHYVIAALVMSTVFVASFSRYSTVSHNVPFYGSCTQAGGPQQDPKHAPDTENVAVGMWHGIPTPEPVTMTRNAVDIMRSGLAYHRNECRPHPYASRWYSWPVMWHPVLFYYDDHSFPTKEGTARVSSIANTGNPALWWMSIVALVFCAYWMTQGTHNAWRLGLILVGVTSLLLMMWSFHIAERPDKDTVMVAGGKGFIIGAIGLMLFGAGCVISATVSRRFVPAFLLLGYLAAWTMWAQGNEDRVLFLYHMLGAVMFIALSLAYALTALRRVRFPLWGYTVSLAPLSTGLVLVVVMAFIFFYPIWTGAPLYAGDRELRIWLPGW